MAATHEVELQLQVKDGQSAGRGEHKRKVLELMLGRFTATNLHLLGGCNHSSQNGAVYYVNPLTGNRSSSFPKRETAGVDSRRRDFQELDLRLTLSCDSPKHLTTHTTDDSMIPRLGRRDFHSYSFSESSNFSSSPGSSYSSCSAISSSASSEATGKSNTSPDKTLKTSKDNTELAVMMLVGCPRCLMYVMTPRRDTKCPRCKSSALFNFLPADSASKRIRTL